MSAEKKPFNETGFGKFLKKAGAFIPDAADVIMKVATGNISGAIDSIGGALQEKAANDQQAASLLMELEMHRMTWELEMERIAAEDRASARSREVEMARAEKRDLTPTVLSAVAVVSFFFILYVIAFRNIPEANRDMFIHALGIIEGGMITLVFQYYFGSSAGSRRKTEIAQKAGE